MPEPGQPVVTRGYVDGPRGPLYACEVSPPEGTRELGAMLIVPPFGEEKKSSRRALHELALAASAAGWRTLSFDFTGTCDSPGEHSELTVELMIDEASACAGWLGARSGSEPVCLGVRLGASVAWALACRRRPRALVLVQPVPDGGKYLWNLLRRKQVREMMTAGASAGVTARAKEAFESGGCFDLDGYEVSSALARGLDGLKLAALRLPEGLSTLLVGLGPRGRVSPEVTALAPLVPGSPSAVGLDVEPFWDRIERTRTSDLQSAVLEFIRSPAVLEERER